MSVKTSLEATFNRWAIDFVESQGKGAADELDFIQQAIKDELESIRNDIQRPVKYPIGKPKSA